jgi:hypothetical protein
MVWWIICWPISPAIPPVMHNDHNRGLCMPGVMPDQPESRNQQTGLFWLASYPKSGNTWFRIVLQAYLADGEINLNAIETGAIASSRNWVDDVAGVDTSDLTQEEVLRLRPHIYDWSAAKDHHTRLTFHKIHDAYCTPPDDRVLINPAAVRGVVYILRNPLDVAPSMAHHNGTDIDQAIARMGNPAASLARDTKSLSAQVLQKLGTWSQHVASWVDAPGLRRHVMRYEDMLADPQGQFMAALTFLHLDPDPARVARAAETSRFERLSAQEQQHGFRENPGKSGNFFRQGKSGSWRETLRPDQIAQVIADHAPMMRRFGYLDHEGRPL